MATIISPSSPDDQRQLPTATLAIPATASGSRRLPPPCWTPDETVALIDAYKDKWYSLRRGNLRANHWQEVADDVTSRCPANPPKTGVQCRHKMEKLRKRYRGEIKRCAARGSRPTSSWVHFQNMHSMEKGSDNPTPPRTSSSDDDDEDIKNNSVKRINDLYNHHQNPAAMHNGSRPGVRIKIPGGAVGGAKGYSRFEATNPNPNPGSNSSRKNGVLGKRGDGDVVGALQALGEGFMRMEKMKMEMARRMEEMRMQMELKRTEMILHSQQRIFDAFAHAINDPHLPA